MSQEIFQFLIGGYTFDAMSFARLVLALLGIYYYSLFSRRLDAVIYQYRLRQLTFAFFALGGLADFLLAGAGNVPVLLVAREVGQLGVAYTIFMASRNVLRSALSAVFVLPFFFTGVVSAGDFDIDILSMISIFLILWAIWNFSIYSRKLAPSRIQDAARRLFLLSLLSSYVFQFVGVMLGVDVYLFVETAETLAVGIGVYVIREVVKASRQVI